MRCPYDINAGAADDLDAGGHLPLEQAFSIRSDRVECDHHELVVVRVLIRAARSIIESDDNFCDGRLGIVGDPHHKPRFGCIPDVELFDGLSIFRCRRVVGEFEREITK